MTECSGSAAILAFPPPEPGQRLRMALRSLVAALEEQREAVAGFRASLESLHGATAGLGGSLSTFQGNLARLDAQVCRLGQTARETAGQG